jgi:tryptophan-rich sensory protein
MRLNKTIKLIFWIAIFEMIGFLLGLLTQANIPSWYNSLNKSSFTPPGVVFSIVWTILYALLAFIAWMLSSQKQRTFSLSQYLFALQMLMNWSWTVLFFYLHWLTFSAIWLIILTCLNLFLIIHLKKTEKVLAFLLSPYYFWLIFASYLNVVIALIN